MKIFFFTNIAAALTLAGCGANEAGTDGQLRLTSGVVEQVTRAFIPTQSTSISNGEQVSVWVDDAGVAPPTPLYEANQLTADWANFLTGGDPMFFPKNGHNIHIYAIHGNFTYPITTGAKFPKIGMEYKVETVQGRGVIANYTKSDLLYAYEKNVDRTGGTTKRLNFYHMLSKLELAIRIGEGSPQLASVDAVRLNGVRLNGIFTPSTTADMSVRTARASMLFPALVPRDGNITLGQDVSADFLQGLVYNECVLVPQEMGGKLLTFTMRDGSERTYPIPTFGGKDNALFESGMKYRYHITLTSRAQSGIEVTSEIVDWEGGGAPVAGDAGE